MWILGTKEYPFYLYRGEHMATLFEGGIGPTGPVLEAQLHRLGIGREELGQLVITHAHPDHVMAVPSVRRLNPDIQVLASVPAAKMLSVEKAVSFFGKMDEALAGALVASNLVESDCARPALSESCITVDRTLSEGDSIVVDEDVAFEVLETPGHSECSLSFYEPNRRVLIISDATGYYLPQLEWCWPNYFTDYGQYVTSIERLAKRDADVLCLSHNAVIVGADNVVAYFDRILSQTHAYHQEIVEAAKAGQSVREIAERLGSQVFEKTPLMPLDFFQKNCGILVKNSLRYEGVGDA
jgi:glyoxylase-like metal-dependent hydrolase (beta-lactamase superfamily II)